VKKSRDLTGFQPQVLFSCFLLPPSGINGDGSHNNMVGL
jgi:hypothetical protein